MFALGCGLTALAIKPPAGGTAPAPSPSFPAEARPATFSITYTGNVFGDSTRFGVGAPLAGSGGATSDGGLLPMMRAGVTSGPAAETFNLSDGDGAAKADGVYSYFGNGGYSGKNSTVIAGHVVNIKTNYSAQITGRINFFGGGINDSNATATPSVSDRRNWPAFTNASFATMAAQAVGAPDYFFVLGPVPSGAAPGTSAAADWRYHRRAMAATYGRRVIDESRLLRFRRQRENPTPGNADSIALSLGIIPYRYRGYPTLSGEFADGDPAITQTTAPAAGSAGTDGALIWATNTNAMWRCGAGGWQLLDDVHPGRVGNIARALISRDVQAASEGTGPPMVATTEMRCPKDAADGAAIGQLAYTGTATAFALATMDGTLSADYAVSSTGAVTRLGTGALADGLTTLIVAATNANGTLYSPLDIYVTRASTVTAPQMRTIASPGVTLAAREAFGSADTGVAALSFAMWINPAAWSSSLFNTTGVASNSPLLISLLGNGKLRMTTKNAAGTQAIINGAAVLALGMPKWVFGKITPTGAQLYINDTADTLTGTFQGSGSFDFVNTGSAAAPIWLGSASANQITDVAGGFVGSVGFLAFWDADIDWSVQATRRQLMNADFSPLAGRTPYSAVGGVAPRMEMWGGLGDWLYGTPDGSNGPQTMSLDYRALTRMT